MPTGALSIGGRARGRATAPDASSERESRSKQCVPTARVFPAELAIGRVEVDGPPVFTACLRDITERKSADDALRRAEARYRALVEQLPLAVYIDRVDRWSSNIYTSPQIEDMLGYSAAEWVANPTLFVDLLHPDDRERVLAAHESVHAAGDSLAIDYRLRSKDGRTVWVHDESRIVADVDTGEPVLQGYLLDVTARNEAEEQLRHQAFHDPLTGLANRALFTDRVEHALVVRGEVAVVFLDLDDFKAVNDSLGHLCGDTLLRDVASRLRAVLRPSDTIARLGGDEFAILVEEAGGAADAVDVADSLIAALRAPFDLDSHEVFMTASVGIGVGVDAVELLRSADVAMYRAKASGKAQHVLYAPLMDRDVMGRLELAADLRRARAEDEMVLDYQPIVELESGRIVAVEALVRWPHPTRGLLAPAEFIGLAEESGQILDIGRWVLAEACRQTADWRALFDRDLGVSVNVSTRQIRRPGLMEDICAALASSGLAPAALALEITETTFARRQDEMAGILDDLTSIGAWVALDDFGTGYSSLSLLRDMPAHMLKIDRSFVRDIEIGGRKQAFVRAILDLAQALGLHVVVEGIETAEQLSALRTLGCVVGQGFHLARPMSPSALEKLLASDGRAPERFGRSAAA